MIGTKVSIKKRVMAKVTAKIEAAQKNYDDGCLKIDEEATQKKELLADKLVDEIIN